MPERHAVRPRLHRLLVLAAWLLPCSASLASAPAPEDPLAALQASYMRVVKPLATEAELYRGLFGTALPRVQRAYPQEVDVPALTAAAQKTFAALEPESGEPAAVFKKAI